MTASPQQIGPGRLVLVVGPSGSGKDTIISGAKKACTRNSSIVFPRRVVTRAASAAEDHDTLDYIAFDRKLKERGFAFWWRAHGLMYGIPRSAEDDILAGRTVICNVSRCIVDDLRKKYSCVDVILVTAPPDILTARLENRSRPSDGPLERRLVRNNVFQQFKADYIIENVGANVTAVEAFLKIIESGRAQSSA